MENRTKIIIGSCIGVLAIFGIYIYVKSKNAATNTAVTQPTAPVTCTPAFTEPPRPTAQQLNDSHVKVPVGYLAQQPHTVISISDMHVYNGPKIQ